MDRKIINLNDLPNSDKEDTCDVCVIGAGAAGLYLAKKLSERNLSVIILEAGAQKSRSAAEMGFDAIFEEEVYRGATDGRMFGLGGSTTAWGGALAPHTSLDTRNIDDPFYNVWDHISAIVKQNADEVLSDLGGGTYQDFFHFHQREKMLAAKILKERGFEVISGIFLPFTRRNFARLRNQATIYLGAVVIGRVLADETEGFLKINALHATSKSGNGINIFAKHFVVAAGTLESTRILLEVDNWLQGRFHIGNRSTGHFFSDHLSVAVAHVNQNAVSIASHLFGPTFLNGSMRDFRFILKTVDSAIPRHFYHFVFEQKIPAFEILREVLQGIQSRRMPRLKVGEVFQGIAGIIKFGYHRFFRQNMYISPTSDVNLYLDVEQAPTYANCLSLSTELDVYGGHSLVINWKIQESDKQNIERLKNILLEKWPWDSKNFPVLEVLATDDMAKKPYDVFHPVGTCRMGDDGGSTVDLDLKVKGAHNLYVLSTGVLPSAGTVNPTFTVLCLGKRLSEHIAIMRE